MTNNIKRLESIIVSTKDPRQKIDAINELAWILRDSDIEKGFSLSEEADALSTSREFFDSPYQKGLADSLRNLGMLTQLKSNYSEAISYSLEALSIYHQLKDIQGQIDIYYILGFIYEHLGNYPEALSYNLKGLELCDQSDDISNTAKITMNIGTIYNKLGEHQKELEAYQSALEIHGRVKNHRGETVSYNNIAMAYYGLEKYPEALEAGKKCLALAKKHQLCMLEAAVLCTIGEIYLEQNDLTPAQTYFEKSLKQAKEISFRYIELYNIFNIARRSQKLNEYDEALEFYLQALEIAEEMDEKHIIYQACQAISEVNKANGNLEAAFEYFEKYHRVENEVLNNKIAFEIKNLEIYYQSAAEQREKVMESEFRALFEGLPIAVIEADGSQINEFFDSLEKSGISNIDAYFDEQPEQLSHCLSLLRPIHINTKAVELFKAKDKEQMVNDYAPIIFPDSFDAHKKIMVEFFEGELHLEALTTLITFEGEILKTHLSISMAEEHRHDFKKVIISILDVTEQKQMEEKLHQLTITDPLTQISNRRHFFSIAVDEHQRAIRHQGDLAIILFDLDHFKKVNDTYGHNAGDIVLQKIAQLCQDQLRTNDLIARYGGEEFAVVLPETTLEEAKRLAERLRKTIAEETIIYDDNKINVTISAGVTHFDPAVEKSIEELMEQADKALYNSKENDRNQVSVWQPN